ncbi:MAG: 50S ribosomal protein L4 [Parcubacteria bacterium OLB19]|nr:MAG: 50S ribosomal protein L4 [Parcubacteria bacterium OLB19]
MDAKVYSSEGSEVGKVSLPETVFGVKWNADLVHEVVVGMQANARVSTAHTKGRGEVRGGGKKPWKQKGTGRARHGSSRSPIWAGGGVAHGPTKDKDYSVKINKKVRAKALATVLSKKLSDAEIIFVDSLALTEPKTAKGKSILNALAKGSGQSSLATKRKNTALVVLPGRNEVAELSFRNFGNIEVVQAKDINPVDLLTYKYVVMAEPNNTIEVISKRVSGSAVVNK